MGNDNIKDYPPYLDYPKERKPTTNADRIRSMSDEELAEWIETIANCRMCKIGEEHCSGGETNSRASCMIHWLDWLKQEVTNDT